MMEFAFLLAVVFGGFTVLTPVVGVTVYLVTRPWLNAYAARQKALSTFAQHPEYMNQPDRDYTRY